jgi:hypothetical protein
VEVVPAELIAHAGHVELVADDVAQAKSAGGGVSVGPDAYGYLCSLVPQMLGSLQDIIVDGIEAARASLDDTADRLRAAAGGYTGADNTAADTVDSLYGPR